MFEEKYQKLQEEIGALTKKSKAAETEAREVNKRYREVASQYKDHRLLDEHEEADALEPELNSLREQMENFQAQERPSVATIKAAVQRSPNGALGALARQVQMAGLERFDELVKEIDEISGDALIEAKAHYLDLLKRLGNSWRELYRVTGRLLSVEEFLPDDEREGRTPNPMPYGSKYSIDDELAEKTYGRRAF